MRVPCTPAVPDGDLCLQQGLLGWSSHQLMTPTSAHPMSPHAVPGLPSALLSPSPIPVPPVPCPAAAHAVTMSPGQAPEGRIPPSAPSLDAQKNSQFPGEGGPDPAVSLCTPVGKRAGARLRPRVCIGCNKAEWEPQSCAGFFARVRAAACGRSGLSPAAPSSPRW